jgi:hypothetical protein
MPQVGWVEAAGVWVEAGVCVEERMVKSRDIWEDTGILWVGSRLGTLNAIYSSWTRSVAGAAGAEPMASILMT